jgi:hypothetical protein
MEMTNQQILEITFAQMPNEFTSNEFTNKLRKNKYDNRWIANHDNVKYLQQHAIQLSLRRWKKLNVRIDTSVTLDKIQEAIELLKSQGYKVMKQVSEYKEI